MKVWRKIPVFLAMLVLCIGMVNMPVSAASDTQDGLKVTLTTDLQEDLEADSLDLFQVINEIEDAFDVKIETEEGIKTVGDLVDFVEKNQD